MKNLKVQFITALVAVTTLTSFVVPSTYSMVSANEVIKNEETQAETVDFPKISVVEEHLKYDRHIEFNAETKTFSLTEGALKELTADEIKSIQEKLKETNFYAKNLTENNSQNENVQITANSSGIIVQELSREVRGAGKTAIAFYWWGARIWLSKSVVNNLGSGITIGGIWVPFPIAKGILGTLGVVMGRSPHGIVFNFTPGIPFTLAGIWGISFQ